MEAKLTTIGRGKRRSTSGHIVLQEFIKPLLSKDEGLTPHEVLVRLSDVSTRQGSRIQIAQLSEINVRRALFEMFKQEEVQREDCCGPSKGKSHKYFALECTSQQDQRLTPDVRALEFAFGDASEQETERVRTAVRTSAQHEEEALYADSNNAHAAHDTSQPDAAPTFDQTLERGELAILAYAQSLKLRMDQAKVEISDIESRKLQGETEASVLDGQTKEQKAREVESLAKAERLRKEAQEAEAVAADSHQRAVESAKEAEDKRKGCDGHDRDIDNARKGLAVMEEQLKKAKEKLGIE
jgi:hypothetical protein